MPSDEIRNSGGCLETFATDEPTDTILGVRFVLVKWRLLCFRAALSSTLLSYEQHTTRSRHAPNP